MLNKQEYAIFLAKEEHKETIPFRLAHALCSALYFDISFVTDQASIDACEVPELQLRLDTVEDEMLFSLGSIQDVIAMWLTISSHDVIRPGLYRKSHMDLIYKILNEAGETGDYDKAAVVLFEIFPPSTYHASMTLPLDPDTTCVTYCDDGLLAIEANLFSQDEQARTLYAIDAITHQRRRYNDLSVMVNYRYMDGAEEGDEVFELENFWGVNTFLAVEKVRHSEMVIYTQDLDDGYALDFIIKDMEYPLKEIQNEFDCDYNVEVVADAESGDTYLKIRLTGHDFLAPELCYAAGIFATWQANRGEFFVAL